MADLQHPRWMYLKALLFLGIGAVAATLILLESPRLTTAAYLALVVWAFCRAYYFAFYVIQHYIDPAYRFSGLLDFAKYLATKKRD